MITRIFFPVGQGAFYAEKHEKFNMVYDCGNRWKTKNSQKVVRQSFSKNESIEILFVSHFDFDHISLIGTLKDTVKSIKHVVLPLLNDEQRILIGNIHEVIGAGTSDIINRPSVFFGDETKITYVEPSENNDVNINNALVLDDNIPENIGSGTPIKIKSNGGHYNWCFIPFNIESKTRSAALEFELKKAGFDVDELKTNPSYALNNIIHKKEKNAIKKIYEYLSGDINENSLVVYSGPYDMDSKYKIGYSNFHNDILFNYHLMYGDMFDFPYDKVACVFTGDVNLNKFDITAVFGPYWEEVGTVQIPHHGSLHSFDEGFLSSKVMYCPISFGVNNNYGHPSYDVVGKIIKKGSCVINITENMDSGYIQYIDI